MSQSVILTHLAGRKVKLRPFKEVDITSSYTAWLNDKRVTRFSNQRFLFHTEASSRTYLASFIGTSNLFVSIRDAKNDEAIGTMTAYINCHHGTADVGLLVGDPASWGRGYGQDAWNTLGNWLLGAVGIRKLTAGTAVGNIAMIRIMERFDMRYEATRYGQELIENMPHDLVYYARFRDS